MVNILNDKACICATEHYYVSEKIYPKSFLTSF